MSSMRKNEKRYVWQSNTVPFQPLVSDLGGSSILSTMMQNADLATFFQTAFRAAITIGAILAVARIAYGGFLYMTKDSFSVKSDAKKIITDALIGLVLLLATVLILRQINPKILNLDILFPDNPSSGQENSSNTTVQQVDAFGNPTQ